MAGSIFGTLFTVTTWGESHGPAIGAVIDGCPAGLPLCTQDIQSYLNRRKPGQSRYTTARKETDQARILSGVFEGKTTGTPISLIIENEDHHSKDYDNLKSCYRPGHADYTFEAKYGFRDHRGGGRSSGRETIGRVAAGAVAAKLLQSLGISLTTFTKSIGPISVPSNEYHLDSVYDNALYMPDNAIADKAAAFLEQCIKDQNSCGGVIECIVNGMPPGVGEPVFDKLDAALAKAVMSVGAVKAVEIGDGYSVSSSLGSENNDSFTVQSGQIIKATNHSGGTLGGMSDASPLILRAAIKPTPSISRKQTTVGSDAKEMDLIISGRHDPVIVPRAVVVVEAMTALTIADMLMRNMSSRLSYLEQIYL